MKLAAIIGARPQFIKHFPFELACNSKIELITIHTGQHYDANMSKIFFDELKMASPDFILDVGSGAHGLQTGKMMVEIEKILRDVTPDGVVVYGDTNSTLSGALVAAKMHLPIFHIEAGLRSYNKKMPEEINRVLTDHVSDLLFVPSENAVSNLRKEGIENGVLEVGDIMKDLVYYVFEKNILGSTEKPYDEFYYATIHRPYNTDQKKRLASILNVLDALDKKVVFSLHPRTKNLASDYGIDLEELTNIDFISPQSYFENLKFLNSSSALITDSGGMQKEAYWLKRKCVTIRKETEWTETFTGNANVLVFDDLTRIQHELQRLPSGWNEHLYGEGDSASKIVYNILQFLN